MKNFAILGVAGVVAPRHLEAIIANGGRIVAAADPNDSVGVLDRYSFEVPFFTEVDRFERYLEELRLGPADGRVHYLTICSPNFRHEDHCRLGLRLGADVICEKPVVISPQRIDGLLELEAATGRRVWTILQLRTDDRLASLREELKRSKPGPRHDVVLTYVTARGRWYDVSWKGDVEKSGGVATNIGVHMFDLLVWLFGPAIGHAVHLHGPRRMAGVLELEHARVSWLLSVEENDLPRSAREAGKRSFRTITIDGTEIDFSVGFTELHARVYERTMAGNGFSLEDARPSIDLAHRVRHATVESPRDLIHPLLR